jgi:hypothetical protein
VRIDEGRLVERRCPHCKNLERRAFGESESERGELASYALGWTAGHEDLVGYMTVGIGVGNPGGGTFHVEARIPDGGSDVAMRLVDTPFETVPEGGPDLTRAEALAHDDLEYVWFVVDEVMEQDRRARWMKHWLIGTPALVSDGVLAETAPVRRVELRDEDEWLLRENHDAAGLRTAHLFHSLDRDPSLIDVLGLEPGQAADRSGVGDPWSIGPIS